jgi:hypothetical protein
MGKGIYEVFETSLEAENEGQWCDYGEGPSGKKQRILLARMAPSNKKFQAAYDRFQREYGRQSDAGTLANDTARAAMIVMMADSIILQWEGFCDRDGVEMPYCKENVIKLLTDLPDFFTEMREQASGRENFLKIQDVADAGN